MLSVFNESLVSEVGGKEKKEPHIVYTFIPFSKKPTRNPRPNSHLLKAMYRDLRLRVLEVERASVTVLPAVVIPNFLLFALVMVR